MTSKNFWEDKSRVESFAAKAADHRLVELVKQYPFPSEIKVLDLGCAAGRNTLFMAECGFDIWAVDSSQSMIEKTQDSLLKYCDAEKISTRILFGKMDDLSWAEDNYFDVIIALGIYHNAQSEAEFIKALSESHRVLKRKGKLLVANFSPGTKLPHMNLVKDLGNIWKDEKHGNLFLLSEQDLDRKMKDFNFFPETKTTTVIKTIKSGKRITVNALYTKQ